MIITAIALMFSCSAASSTASSLADFKGRLGLLDQLNVSVRETAAFPWLVFHRVMLVLAGLVSRLSTSSPITLDAYYCNVLKCIRYYEFEKFY